MCEILIEGYEVTNVNVAVVLSEQDIFANLISATRLVICIPFEAEAIPVDEGIVKSKLENKLF